MACRQGAACKVIVLDLNEKKTSENIDEGNAVGPMREGREVINGGQAIP